MSDDIDFVEGLRIKPPLKKDGTPLPNFIKAKGSIKVQEMIGWLQTVDTEWVNIEVRESKKGNWYVKVDNWTPTKDDEYEKGMHSARNALSDQGDPGIDDDDIPF